jgi:2-oxo-3-hexenedioate decarboxylase
MTQEDYTRIMAELLAAYDAGTMTTLPSQTLAGFDMAAGYAMGAELARRRRERGERPAGRKIGFTNQSIWAQFGIERPIWAPVYVETIERATAGQAEVSLAKLAAPRIEPEIVFGLRTAITPGNPDPAALLPAIEWYALGFEIVQCHYPGWQFTLPDGVADFGLHGKLIIGTPVMLPTDPPAELITHMENCSLSLSLDGVETVTGSGAEVLGSPLKALAFLVSTLAEEGGPPLVAGEIITTGTLTNAQSISPGERWTATPGGIDLAPLTATFIE